MYSVDDFDKPQILAAEKDFLIVYKPPRMHSAPLANSSGQTILKWCAIQFPEIMDLPGRKAGEGGLLHRLDYETHGIMLLAHNKFGMEALLSQQEEGKIQKEYCALSAESKIALPGFPQGKPGYPPEKIITSAFRPYGPGRKAVRPVCIDTSKDEGEKELYITEILESHAASAAGFFFFRLMISKGFRHQIRSHLAWMGMPILNDELYGGAAHGKGLLALRAFSITFTDPSSGKKLDFVIPPMEPADI